MIRVKFDIVPPTATAQQKGVFVRNGRAHFFTKERIRAVKEFFAAMLAPHVPAEPMRGGVYFQARWCYPYRKSEPKRNTAEGREIPHISRPDLDNLEKALLDTMTALGFWHDDAQVYSKSTVKVWGPRPYLAIAAKSTEEMEAV